MQKESIKFLFKILSKALILITVVISGFIFLIYKGSHPPKPKSDVPIIYKIGAWPYQETLTVTDLKGRIISKKLNIFNGTAVVEYEISGHLKYKKPWKPFIKEVNVNEQWVEVTGKERVRGVINITPIVAVKNADNYNGEELPFTVKVQDYLNTGNWGSNMYTIRSFDKMAEIELFQNK